MNIKDTVVSTFTEQFGEAPTHIIRAPGRVNLIGEHTDYNDGFVLPMAINRAVWIALRPVDTPSVSIKSLDFDEPITFNLNDYAKEPNTPADYVKGVAWALQDEGHTLHGWEGIMKGDVPIGAGLSSSAALGLAIAQSFAVISDIDWHPAKMALLVQKGENKWVGINSGIMDQMISASGKDQHALLIDCRSLDTELLPLPTDTAVIVLDTNTRRELVTSAYNERRQQCETAAQHFGVSHLRDVTVAEFYANKTGLDDLTARRAYHVIAENVRVLMAKQAMLDNDPVSLGILMQSSHISLRDYFEVTNEALRVIVDAAQAHPATYGARMTGAGFGGCAVALIRADAVDDFSASVSAAYEEKMGIAPTLYITTPTDGAAVIA